MTYSNMVNTKQNTPYLYKDILRCYCGYEGIYFAHFCLLQRQVMFETVIKIFVLPDFLDIL